MMRLLSNLRHSLFRKVVLTAGMTLLGSVLVLSYIQYSYMRAKLMDDIVQSEDKVSTTLKLGLHYSMMLNSRQDTGQVIKNVARQPDIKSIRIYNKDGQIKFSNVENEVDEVTNIRSEACYVCHQVNPPKATVSLEERTRIVYSPEGYRMLGILSPIYNEPGCSEGCHVHPPDKKVLGALDVVVSLRRPDEELFAFLRKTVGLAAAVVLLTSLALFYFTDRFIKRPVGKLIEGTERIAAGHLVEPVQVDQDDELGRLAKSVNRMGREISLKQREINRSREEYRQIFEQVPCYVTIQDRDFRLLRYNREFARAFDPQPGDHCFYAYKGRSGKCENCPVERTFADGKVHFSEESGYNKDGSPAHWLVTTSPITNEHGQVVAAMEMCLDITSRKQLEDRLEQSEKKYYSFFSNVPNPVFVLDVDTLEIIDCNASVDTVYACGKSEVVGRSFLDLFPEEDRERYAERIRAHAVINQARQLSCDGRWIYVDIHVSPSEYPGKKVLLASTNDITKRLEAEQQLIQAGKMATLGEMATGVAHELNQPLTVIKTASGFLMRKVRKGQAIEPDILETMAGEIDAHVDRATRIITHMREFGRKSELTLRPVDVNEVLERSFEIFHQQLKLREIGVEWALEERLPSIMADPQRLEQVFINLLINARDAVEERAEREEREGGERGPKRVRLESSSAEGRVLVAVIDSGTGIPKGVASRIFEPFFTTKKVGKGTGLGLSISYGLVKDCGGSIAAENNDWGGATFRLSFPAPGGANAEHFGPDDAGSGTSNGGREKDHPEESDV